MSASTDTRPTKLTTEQVRDVAGLGTDFERLDLSSMGALFYNRLTGELVTYDAHEQVGQHYTRQ